MNAEAPAVATFVFTWLANAKPGDRVEYWRGFISRDLAEVGAGAKRSQLLAVKRDAWEAYDEGFVHLVQRRHGPDDYSYFMVMRSARLVPPPKFTRGIPTVGGGWENPALQGKRRKKEDA